MKIILSRKGFDSGSGGFPSPIFPDGGILSLPIPDRLSRIQYGDIQGNDWASMGDLVSQLAGIPQSHRAHLDPDIALGSLPRMDGWRPIFGQVGSAEGHLRNQGVGSGDIFLYFGLFQQVEKGASGWQYVRGSRPMHILFGWLQIAERVPVSAWPAHAAWGTYHPHFGREPESSNVIYLSTERLRFAPGEPPQLAGAGTFSFFSPLLRLTAPASERPGLWRLPNWFHPADRRSTLSYHSKPNRWTLSNGNVLLSSVSRGQEFVLDCDDYPEAVGWAQELLTCSTKRLIP